MTEAPLDKKVKISSMKNKLTSGASSMVEMRKEGPHSLLMKTLDKGHDVNKLLEKRTMMVQADLNDKLQRDILVLLRLVRSLPSRPTSGFSSNARPTNSKSSSRTKTSSPRESPSRGPRAFTPRSLSTRWGRYLFP